VHVNFFAGPLAKAAVFAVAVLVRTGQKSDNSTSSYFQAEWACVVRLEFPLGAPDRYSARHGAQSLEPACLADERHQQEAPFRAHLDDSEAHWLVEGKAVTSTSARMANPGGGEENGSHAGEDGTVVTGGGATHGGYSYSSR